MALRPPPLLRRPLERARLEAELGKFGDGAVDDGPGIDIVRFDFRKLAQVAPPGL